MAARPSLLKMKVAFAKVNREFDWVEFHFDDSAHDTLELIETSHRNISLYIEELRKLTS
ncbi:hypothetical protein HYO59_24395 [Vibrio parahaemolyticus]|nr:hypothetical protein [Vibrio parahaemolyticus]